MLEKKIISVYAVAFHGGLTQTDSVVFVHAKCIFIYIYNICKNFKQIAAQQHKSNKEVTMWSHNVALN